MKQWNTWDPYPFLSIPEHLNRLMFPAADSFGLIQTEFKGSSMSALSIYLQNGEDKHWNCASTTLTPTCVL